MNPTLELTFWTRLLGILALEISLVIALAFAVQSLTQSAFWRRTIWQICFVCLLLLVTTELTGFGRGFAVWFAGKPPVERKFSVRNIPLDEQYVSAPVETEISPPMEFSEKETPIVHAVWWPGMLWLAGLAVIVARILFARILFLTLRWRKTKITDATLLNRVSELAHRLGIHRKIHLLESPGFSSPMTFGIVQPSIALPENFAQNFSSAEQNAMLTHELAHVAARDPFWYLLADLTGALLWWHPLVWLARRRLHSASELAADEAAAILENGPGTLAECLVNLGQRLTQSRSFGWLGVDGNGFRSHLGQRVERLLNLKETKPNNLRGWPLFFAKTAATIFFGGLIVFTSGWIQNGKALREENLSSAVQKSWNGSFASMTLAALAEERKISVSEKSVSESMDKNQKLNPNAPNQPVIPQPEASKKSILVTVKIFSSPPNAVIEGDPNRVEPNELAKAFADFLERDKDNQLLGTPSIKSLYGQEGEIFIGQNLAIDSEQTSKGIYLSVLPQAKGDSVELDLIARIGNFAKDRKWVENSGVNFRTTVIIPSEESAVLHRQQSAAHGGTNYFIIITPSIFGQKELEKKAAVPKQGEELHDLFPRFFHKPDADPTKREKPDAKIAAATLVQDGKLLLESGNLEAAEIKLNEALKIDAENKAALYYKSLVNEAQQARLKQKPKSELIRPAIPTTTLDKAIVDVSPAINAPNSSIQPTNEAALYTRVFKVNPRVFEENLRKPFSTGSSSTNEFFFQGSLNQMVRDFFQAAGVDFGVPGTPNGKAVFFNDLNGKLLVRASMQDLELIQTAIETLTYEPPQVVIETKFVEIDETAMKKLGLDWFVRNGIASLTNLTASDVSLRGLDKIEAAKNSSNSLPATAVIFTDTQYQTVLKALEKAKGVDLLTAPKVTTLSGRQTQISLLDTMEVVTRGNFTNANGIVTNGLQTNTLPFGPVLDVIPGVSSDGLAIQLTVIANLTEALDDEDGDKIVNGKPTDSSLQSHVRIRTLMGNASIWDGQTLMLAREDRNQPASKQKSLFVFVTATIIDPVGNRVHVAEDLPFATNSIPKQPERK